MPYPGARTDRGTGVRWIGPLLVIGAALAGGALVTRALMGISAAASRAVGKKE
jgi:uncharacterized membrane protein YgdD (TMEM256/DUF423 family)